MKNLLAYFRTQSEALHLALEESPHQWKALNSNLPTLHGTIGTNTLRDPFIFEDREGSFHLLATNGWKDQSIIHAHSSNLMDWSDQVLIPVMGSVPGTLNTWAPECFWDRAIQKYRIHWSSTICLQPGVDPKLAWDHRIWSVTTADFKSFSKPSLFFDPGYNIIDATIYCAAEADLMVFKDERGENHPGTQHKALRSARRLKGQERFEEISEEFSPSLVEGPILTFSDGKWALYFDFFMDKHWGGMESSDFKHWTPLSPSFPEGVRHGSIVSISEERAEALRARFDSWVPQCFANDRFDPLRDK